MRKLLAAIALTLWAGTATADDIVIAALGDSLTHGYGLTPDQGFVPQMQLWLNEQEADAVLINAGVSGDTTAGGLARLGWTLTPEVDGLIVALGANDALRGIDPAVAQENLGKILAQARAADLPVLLIGTQAPGNFGAGYKAEFEAIYPELAEAHGALYTPDFLGGLSDLGSSPADYAAYLQADGLHPNSAGVALIVQNLGHAVLELVETARANGPS